jgi:hypothetical protein
MKFDNNMVVYDAINHIKKGLANIEAGRDHGLFRLCPENDSLSVWLNEGRTLGSYDLKSGVSQFVNTVNYRIYKYINEYTFYIGCARV